MLLSDMSFLLADGYKPLVAILYWTQVPSAALCKVVHTDVLAFTLVNSPAVLNITYARGNFLVVPVEAGLLFPCTIAVQCNYPTSVFPTVTVPYCEVRQGT